MKCKDLNIQSCFVCKDQFQRSEYLAPICWVSFYDFYAKKTTTIVVDELAN